jgi:hypothetical protein
MVLFGRRAGQYVARCAQGLCGYYDAWLFYLTWLASCSVQAQFLLTTCTPDLELHCTPTNAEVKTRFLMTDQIFTLTLEDVDEPHPAMICFSQDVDVENQDGNAIGRPPTGVRTLQRSYAMTGMIICHHLPFEYSRPADIGNTSVALPRRSFNSRHWKPLHLLLQLNAVIQPGLSERDFKALFMKYSSGCSLIMTHNAFKSHYCTGEETDVIDITDLGSDMEIQ